MTTDKQRYRVRLFINGGQVGSDSTFAEWYADDESARESMRRYFEGEGYRVDPIGIERDAEGPVATVYCTLKPR